MRVSKGHLGESHPVVRGGELLDSPSASGGFLSKTSRWLAREEETDKVQDEKYTVVGR